MCHLRAAQYHRWSMSSYFSSWTGMSELGGYILTAAATVYDWLYTSNIHSMALDETVTTVPEWREVRRRLVLCFGRIVVELHQPKREEGNDGSST